MSNFTKYLCLPAEITDFEINYLKRLNKLALLFYYAHIPIFMGIAALAGTGVWFALLLTCITLTGPTLAYLLLKQQRSISLVHGFTAMIMGGVLVHFGQGPMQIEMHFYFFALLAMLCMFANPLVNIVAAVTVAIHHLILWWLLPSSIFNYAATFEVVLVHAAFVVLETIAACYISRQFFDNVIGLDKIVQVRTHELSLAQRDMSLILDNIDQGFITVTLDGMMCGKTSAIVYQWFGTEERKNSTFADYLRPIDANAADWFELGLESVADGFLPTEVAFEQLPRLLKIGEKTLKLEYKAVLNTVEAVEKIIVVISDISELVQRELSEGIQKQMLSVFEHIMRDKMGFIDFVTETEQQFGLMRKQEYTDLAHLKRLIHTVKGNAGIFGLTSIADECHALENQIVEEGEVPAEAQITALLDSWSTIRTKLDELLGQGRRRMDNVIKIDDVEYRAILHAVLKGADPELIANMIHSWKLEPVHNRFGSLRQQAERLAKRMGKSEITVKILPNNIRVDKEHWAPFWSSLIHVIRNAIDHGLETSEERISQGKSPAGTLELHANVMHNELLIGIKDDGRGINWDAVAQKAALKNLPNATHVDLVQALFSDGISTKDVVTDISGRGVGMGAVLHACQQLGGSVEVLSQAQQGTEFIFRFPLTSKIFQSTAPEQLKIAA